MNNFLTPTQIFEKYPELKFKLNWTNSDLGFFMRCKLLVGYYSRNKRVSMIDESSLLRLVHHVNATFDNQKLSI
jgi:hypothetical protein